MSKSIRYLLYVSSAILYMVIGIYSVTNVTNWITSEYFDTLGTKAVDIARIVSNKYYITNDEVAELMQLSFREVLEHPANKRFVEIFKGEGYSDAFRFAYILVRLSPNQVRYHVTYENAGRFGAPLGTPLNILWLVNVFIHQDQLTEGYYDDISRYSRMRTIEELVAYAEREPTFVVTRDEFGNAITGYVPIYSIENDFVGMLGIDINFERFERHSMMVRLYFILIFMIPTIILTLAYVLAHRGNIREKHMEASMDPLTSLNNRRFLKNSMPLIINEHYKKQNDLSVIMLDIDFFKKYNDNYGHQMGDEVLIKISEAISSALRSENDIACRYGGEEIMLILKKTGLSGAIYVAERIKNAINKLSIEHKYSDISDIITVSQGIYSAVPLKADSIIEEQFITYADKALYEAKNSGRNKYLVYKG